MKNASRVRLTDRRKGGEKMLEAIKNVCIFLLIAQVLMVLVPEESYAKYVRVLVSLILILKITQPVLALVSGNEARRTMEVNVEKLCEELSVRELPSDLESDTARMYGHMADYLVLAQQEEDSDMQTGELSAEKAEK